MLNGTIFLLAESRPPIWYWEQCDSAAKVVVCILFGLSAWSISTIISKHMKVRELRKNNFAFESRLAKEPKLSESTAAPTAGLAKTPYAQLLSAALSALRQHRGKISGESDVRVCMGHVENATQRAIGRVTAVYEEGMDWLSTCVSGGPFLGLLGTVWGVMVTFGALTEKASIAELAPGVSGALVATTSGLVLAIPALFAYNWLLSRIRMMSTELDNFASAVADQIEIELLEDLREHRAEQAETTVPASEKKSVPAGANPFLRDDDADAGTLPSARASWEQ